MKNAKAKEIIAPVASLFIICIVVTLLLAITNSVTAPKIAQLAVDTENETKQIVLSEAESFSDAKAVSADGTDYTYYEGYSASGEIAGYVFSTSAKGYGGDIDVMVGVGTDGKVRGVSILSISETAGLGMNAEKDSFLNQFVGKSAGIAVSKSSPADNEIQALTGATITSNAMAQAVNTALELYESVGGESNG